jgi:hypothetical protein
MSGMARPHQTKEPELHPDAWARFERAVDIAALGADRRGLLRLSADRRG